MIQAEGVGTHFVGWVKPTGMAARGMVGGTHPTMAGVNGVDTTAELQATGEDAETATGVRPRNDVTPRPPRAPDPAL